MVSILGCSYLDCLQSFVRSPSKHSPKKVVFCLDLMIADSRSSIARLAVEALFLKNLLAETGLQSSNI